jgi:hypothetical protein
MEESLPLSDYDMGKQHIHRILGISLAVAGILMCCLSVSLPIVATGASFILASLIIAVLEVGYQIIKLMGL